MTPEQLSAGFAAGAPVRHGTPTHAPIRGGFATLNLAAAYGGHPDPWCLTQRAGEYLSLNYQGERRVWLGDLRVSETHLRAVQTALAAAPDDRDRHDDLADSMRLEAGRIAMSIDDVMLRSRLLDVVDGWAAVLGQLIDEDPDHGALHDSAIAAPNEDDISTHRLLEVRCPSTHRIYVHRVPQEMETARDARRWVMGLEGDDPDPEVET